MSGYRHGLKPRPIAHFSPRKGEVWRSLTDVPVYPPSMLGMARDIEETWYRSGAVVTVVRTKRRDRYNDVYVLVLIDGDLRSIHRDDFNSFDMERLLGDGKKARRL